MPPYLEFSCHLQQQLSRKEIEELLKKGAYGAIMEENAEESKFNEEDIETILLRRTTTITLEVSVGFFFQVMFLECFHFFTLGYLAIRQA